ncbi:MAG: hypothetical protein HYZ63_01320 [Candidatus Andersenbacteria bacterium]|nr:hypothetical protein [Candidatus Andersenbacteria bacterium]
MRPYTIPRWWHAAGSGSSDGKENPDVKEKSASVVDSCGLHLNQHHMSALNRLQEAFSVAAATILFWVKGRLVCHVGRDPATADSTDEATCLLAADIQLSQAEYAALPPWAQHVVDQIHDGSYLAPKDQFSIRVAFGNVVTSKQGNRYWKLSYLNAKFVLQQLLLVLVKSDLQNLPTWNVLGSLWQKGVGQEVAQQLVSHLRLYDESGVEAAQFPSIAQRDPHQRRKDWEAALDAFSRKCMPCAYQPARELNPRKYKADDPRGDRLVNADPLWHAVLASPDARLLPLLLPDGKRAKLYYLDLPGRRRGKAQERRQWHQLCLAVPVTREFVTTLPPETQRAVRWWSKPQILARLRPLRPSDGSLKASMCLLVLPLSYGRKRFERQTLPLLAKSSPQWLRLVKRTHRHSGQCDRWFSQLTIGYTTIERKPERVLGVHFTINNLYYWSLCERREGKVAVVERGCVLGNQILAASLAEKDELEGEQKVGRGVAGRRYANKRLKPATHAVVDGIISLIFAKCAGGQIPGLAVEDVLFVQKRGGQPQTNLLHSHWNYGKLATVLEYKAPAAGLAVTLVWPKKKAEVGMTDAEIADRIALEGFKRLENRFKPKEEPATA